MKACGNGRWMQSLICSGSRGCCTLVAGMLWWLLLVGAALAAPERAKPLPERPKAATPDPRTEVATRQGATLRLAVAPPGSPQAGHFIDGAGQRLRLMGMNLSGMQYVAIADAATQTNWGNQLDTADGLPDFTALARWHANAVRISLYEASWNANGPNGRCRDVSGRKGKEVEGMRQTCARLYALAAGRDPRLVAPRTPPRRRPRARRGQSGAGHRRP